MKSIIVGDIYSSNSYGDFEILSTYNFKGDRNSILIRFVETGFERRSQIGDIKLGRVKDRLKPTRNKLGFEGIGKYSFHSDKKAYTIFSGILKRCYTNRENYENITVCNYWFNFQNFCEWFYSKESNYKDGYQIDKDLYVEGNREYGPFTCIFVPYWLNYLFTDAKKARTNLPQGVFCTTNFYKARCNINSKQKFGKKRDSITEAEIDYLNMKSEHVLSCMTRNDFPERLLYSIWLRVEKMQERIEILKREKF